MPEDKLIPPTNPGLESADAGEAEPDLGALLETSGGTPLSPPAELPPDDSMESLLEPTAIVLDEVPAAAEPAAEPTAKAIRCEFCGTVDENPSSKFCNTCGRRLTRTMLEPVVETIQSKNCPLCGHKNKLEVRLCANCGQLMRLRNL